MTTKAWLYVQITHRLDEPDVRPQGIAQPPYRLTGAGMGGDDDDLVLLRYQYTASWEPIVSSRISSSPVAGFSTNSKRIRTS